MGDDTSSTFTEAFRSCAEQLKRLLPGTAEVAFLTLDGAVRWSSFDSEDLDEELLERLRAALASATVQARVVDPLTLLAMIPVCCGDEPVGALLAPFAPNPGEPAERAVDRTWRRLRPALDRLGRQLARHRELTAKAALLAEHIEELRWLSDISAELQASADKMAAVERLLEAAVERMDAAFGALTIPERQLSVTYNSRVLDHPESARAYRLAHPYLMSYMQRRAAPLLANRPPAATPGGPACKIMAVPVTRRAESQIGAVAFCKPASLPDFSRYELYLARHIARLIETLLDSRHDPETGLLTRAAVEQDAPQIIAAHEPDEPHAVVYVDVDHLHVINETFGFDFGDRAIAYIAKLLRPPCLPANAVPGRIAGDRFIVFLPACDTARALQWTQSLQRAVSQLTVGLPPQRITLSVSCGIAGVPQTETAFSRAMAAAELACRTAKERGRNRSEVYLDVDDSMMHRQGDILGVVRLRAALEKDRLQMFAQRVAPVRDLGRTRGIECLARLVAEDGAIVSPAQFLSAANRYQLSRALDEWMIKHTLDALQPHASMLFHGEIHVAVNISEQSLRDDDFLRYLEEQVRKSDVAPGLLTFEIAESDALRNLARASLMMRRLKKLGCSVALDDFGASVHSLAHLQSLRPDRIKIEGGVVRDALGGVGSEATIRAIAKLAETLDIECVAKHTESEALVRKLRELGVGYAQGHAVHEAEPLLKLLESLRDEEARQLERLYLEQ